ncbi:MAG: hypothetical protein ISR48_04440 [Alphaproteobacteria bacterium]|nr:hypothetical protein [Alphaproteobacteria bacterium]
MSDLRNTDLSEIPDEDLTPDQKDELQRRFNNFFGPLMKAKFDQEDGKSKKKVRKWTPGEK